MATDNTGKVALITGGARGIGLATAHMLKAEGWRIALADRDTATLEAAAKEVGEDTIPVTLDVSDVSTVRTTIAALAAEAGRLDCLVNNAGVFKNERFFDIDEAGYDWLVDINLKGAFFVMQAAAKAMKEAGNGGVIVNIASASGRSGRPTQTIYGLTKAGLIHLTKSAAMALAPDVRVVAVCPAAVETDMWADTLAQRRAVGGEADVQALFARIPLGRSCTVEELAGAIAFLASDRAAFMTGCAIDFSGGMEMN
jgi:meso-butanediol dehydrogenase/(S,S)-butanediol dehydrogenase/diacetyl reductase